jgi:filamentous hemagglutinin
MATAPSAADQIPTGYPNAPPPTGGTPPSLVSTDNQLNNTGNQNPVTTGGTNNTGGTQIDQPSGSNNTGGYGSGTQPNIGNGVVMSTVPPSILDGNGQLPPVTGVNGGAIDRPATPYPDKTAEQFAKDAFNGQVPDKITPIKDGGWVAKLPDGTFVTYRPAGQASSRTADTTASVDVNSPAINAINNNKPAKFKFPKL